jgi:hypothetical protein
MAIAKRMPMIETGIVEHSILNSTEENYETVQRRLTEIHPS